MKTALPLILFLSTMSSCRGEMDEFDEFDEFGDVQENVVRREIKSDEGSNYYDVRIFISFSHFFFFTLFFFTLTSLQ